MTSVVGILNKAAVALAADSAVTVGGSNGRKIFNHANKVFTLSKHQPIGIMLYNSATFMATPWETIIKMYRKQLKAQSFPTVKAYQEDFVTFLRKSNFFADEAAQKKYHQFFFKTGLDVLINGALKDNKELLANPTDENRLQVLQLIDKKLDELIPQVSIATNVCEDFADLQFDQFIEYSGQQLSEIFVQVFTKQGFVLSEALNLKIQQLLYHFLRCKETTTPYTGLIFSGFGEDEIYPQLLALNISFAFQERLRYYPDKRNATITVDMPGAIRPFAQTDVIDTILSGIDPDLDKTYVENFRQFFVKYNREIITALGATNPGLTAQLRAINIDKLMGEYSRKNQETKNSNYIQPLMNAVSTLSKEDLAEMAESLIYLTYLKRRITFAEESVGGPVDVAIISKGDGFIWIKRKHYFKPELNRHFFDNYFNH